jgi:hypothetical protein
LYCSQGQPHPIPHEQPPPQQQLQELHTQQEQQHMHAQSRLQDQSHQQNTQSHHHNLDQQQQLSMEHQVQQQCMQSNLPSPELVNIGSDSSNTCSSNENSQSSCETQQKTESSRESGEKSEWQKKKKGGKAKGTLETSVEIRNRMIGMSEAGLSTLSIALAIDRSVCKILSPYLLYVKF